MQRGKAVVAVVGFDRIQKAAWCLPGIPERHNSREALESHGCVSQGNAPCEPVKRLQPLYRVTFHGRPQPLPHNTVKIHERAGSKKLVNLVHTNCMASC